MINIKMLKNQIGFIEKKSLYKAAIIQQYMGHR